MSKLPLETDRLIIRPYIESDFETIHAIDRNPVVKQFAGGVKTREESLAGLHAAIQQVEETGYGALAVVEKASRKHIGYCGLRPSAITGDIEIFYTYAQKFWGKGFATEAGRAVLRYGFAGLALKEIIAVVDPENLKSIGVIEKLGMNYTRDVLHPKKGYKFHLYMATCTPR